MMRKLLLIILLICLALTEGAAFQKEQNQMARVRRKSKRPRFPRRNRVAQYRPPSLFARASRQGCAARLLDLLLHQLHAHHSRSEKARKEIPQRAGRHRRSLGQVRLRDATRTTFVRPSCVTKSSIRWSTTKIWRSGNNMRARLAYADVDRPCGQSRRRYGRAKGL